MARGEEKYYSNNNNRAIDTDDDDDDDDDDVIGREVTAPIIARVHLPVTRVGGKQMEDGINMP